MACVDAEAKSQDTLIENLQSFRYLILPPMGDIRTRLWNSWMIVSQPIVGKVEAYIGTHQSQSSVQNICCQASVLTARCYKAMDSEKTIMRLNRILSACANYFSLGEVSTAYLS